MQLPPLTPGRLVRRYKRFLADVELPTGEIVTCAVANPGSMLGLAEPRTAVYLASATHSRRKLPYSWVLTTVGSRLVCTDTGMANRIFGEALLAGQVPELSGYLEIVPEMPLGDHSRADFCLRVHKDNMTARCWVEVKAVTLAEGKTALFPDARTQRGVRHLKELATQVAEGERAVQVFLVQRSGCDCVQPAQQIDPAYARALRDAHAAGVELLAYETVITKRSISLGRPLKVEL